MIKLGSSDIELKLGDQDASKVYLGSEEIYDPIPPEPEVYGVLSFYRDTETTASVRDAWNCEVVIVDQSKYLDYYNASGTTEFTWSNYQWINPITGDPIPEFDTIGLEVSISGGEWATFGIEVNTGIAPSSPVVTVSIDNEEDYNALAGSWTSVQLSVYPDPLKKIQIKEFTFGTLPTSVPDSFLQSCMKLDKVSFAEPSHITSIGKNFLQWSIQSNNLQNFALVMPGSVTTIGNNFLDSDNGFNGTVDLSNVETIGGNFMSGCAIFNNQILLGKVTELPSGFMFNCRAFNQEIDFNNITVINYQAISNWQAFNKPLSFPNLVELKISAVTSGTFFYGLDAFNSTISMPKLTRYNNPDDKAKYAWVFSGFKSFTGELTIPATFVENTGAIGFTGLCQSAYTLKVESAVIPGINLPSTNKGSAYAASSSASDAYTKGITVTGTYASELMTAFPNHIGYPYRKLVQG